MWFVLPLLSLVYLFVFWRKLKEDYYQESLFSLGLTQYGLLAGLYFISTRINNPANFFYLEIVFVLLGYFMISFWFKRGSANKLEIVEGTLLAFWLMDVLWGSYQRLFWEAGLSVFSLVVFWLETKNYKKFNWYKSGRVGIAGVTALGLRSLVKGSMVLMLPAVFPFRFAPLVFGLFAFANFVLVYKLANKLS